MPQLIAYVFVMPVPRSKKSAARRVGAVTASALLKERRAAFHASLMTTSFAACGMGMNAVRFSGIT